MRRHGTPYAPTDEKHADQKEPAHANEREKIEDVSGENWDEAAITAIESMTHENSEPETLNSKLPESEELPRPNLSNADLHGADLRTADLSGSILAKANLSEARLDRAKLNKADLRGADLRSCNLSEARLNGANLYGAFFNQKTRLPFDKAEAIRRGMIFFDVEPDQI